MKELIRPTAIEYYGRVNETEVYVKRDDTIPFSFGGNKVRIAREIFAEIQTRGNRAVVTYGSASSNLNRVMAQMAAAEHLPCTCIIKKENSGSGHPSFNELMVLDSGAEIVYTTPEEVHKTVKAVLDRLTAKGLEPYYVYGDSTGKGGEEVLVRAYRKAGAEIVSQEKELGLHFDTIALPVGTGATFAGLAAAGGGRHQLLGISVANPAGKTGDRVRELLTAAGMTEEAAAGLFAAQNGFCRITDSYLLGGYGKYTRELTEFIRTNLRERGLALDPVYSGKAFAGLIQEIEKKNVSGTCLFLHTGGLPLLFDLMEQM